MRRAVSRAAGRFPPSAAAPLPPLPPGPQPAQRRRGHTGTQVPWLGPPAPPPAPRRARSGAPPAARRLLLQRPGPGRPWSGRAGRAALSPHLPARAGGGGAEPRPGAAGSEREGSEAATGPGWERQRRRSAGSGGASAALRAGAASFIFSGFHVAHAPPCAPGAPGGRGRLLALLGRWLSRAERQRWRHCRPGSTCRARQVTDPQVPSEYSSLSLSGFPETSVSVSYRLSSNTFPPPHLNRLQLL